MNLPDTFKNPWACENTVHGSGFMGMELELFLCPKCGSEPSMVDEYPSGIGMICINCGFGIRPMKNEVQAVAKWQKAVRQYCEVNRRTAITREEAIKTKKSMKTIALMQMDRGQEDNE